MIDVSEIDLDKLTTLELWELHERVAARLGPPGYREHYDGSYEETCPAQSCGFDSYSARERMRVLL